MRPIITLDTLGWVYLWHFSRPLGNPASPRGQAQHYGGFAADEDGDMLELERRAAQHLAGRGAKITRAAIANGIEISLVVAWRAPLSFEKQLKRRKDMPNLCPICAAARGRKARRIVVPAEQLVLPLFDAEPWDGDDFPTPPVLAMDGYEYFVTRCFRQASAQTALAVGCTIIDTFEDIPY